MIFDSASPGILRPAPAKTPPAPSSSRRKFGRRKRFYLDLAPPASMPMAVVCGGCERLRPDYAIHRPSFPYYSIEFVARGKGQLRAGPDTEFAMLPGIGIFLRAGNFPAHRHRRRRPLAKYFVDFTGTRAEELLRQFAPALGTIGRVAAPGEIQRIFDKLIQNGQKATPLFRAAVRRSLEYLVLKIAECQTPAEAAQTPAFATYERCRRTSRRSTPGCKTLLRRRAAVPRRSGLPLPIVPPLRPANAPPVLDAAEDEPGRRPPAGSGPAGQEGGGRVGVRRSLPFFPGVQAGVRRFAGDLPTIALSGGAPACLARQSRVSSDVHSDWQKTAPEMIAC